jgi:hypothetical protein
LKATVLLRVSPMVRIEDEKDIDVSRTNVTGAASPGSRPRVLKIAKSRSCQSLSSQPYPASTSQNLTLSHRFRYGIVSASRAHTSDLLKLTFSHCFSSGLVGDSRAHTRNYRNLTFSHCFSSRLASANRAHTCDSQKLSFSHCFGTGLVGAGRTHPRDSRNLTFSHCFGGRLASAGRAHTNDSQERLVSGLKTENSKLKTLLTFSHCFSPAGHARIHEPANLAHSRCLTSQGRCSCRLLAFSVFINVLELITRSTSSRWLATIEDSTPVRAGWTARSSAMAVNRDHKPALEPTLIDRAQLRHRGAI